MTARIERIKANWKERTAYTVLQIKETAISSLNIAPKDVPNKNIINLLRPLKRKEGSAMPTVKHLMLEALEE